MAIRGIDTQIMVNRMPDNAKETSDVLKRPEVIQDILGNQHNINDAQDQTRVAKLSESEMEQIRSDVDGAAGEEYEEGEGKEREKEAEEDKTADQEFFVPKERHFIDIKI